MCLHNSRCRVLILHVSDDKDGSDALSELTKIDTYNKLIFWTMIEQTSLIILGSVPTLRPFFRRVLGRNSSARTPHSRGYTQQITGNGTFRGTTAIYGPRTEQGAELDEVPFARDKGAINVSTSYSVRVADEDAASHHA